MNVTDQEILLALRGRLESGGNLLFARYYKPLVLFADTMISDLNYSEDLVQDVFYKFIRDKVYLNDFPLSLSSYLFRAVKNACLNVLNRKDVVRYGLELMSYDEEDDEPFLVEPQLIENILREIEGLPERTKYVIKSVIFEGKKYQEVADACEISINTVKTLLKSGLKHLRTLFPDYLVLLFFMKRISFLEKK